MNFATYYWERGRPRPQIFKSAQLDFTRNTSAISSSGSRRVRARAPALPAVRCFVSLDLKPCGGSLARARRGAGRCVQLGRDLAHLAGMSHLMTANKQQPLIEIDRAEHEMWLNDFAQSQTVASRYAGAERGPRLFQCRPGRRRIEFTVGTNFFGSVPSTAAIGDQCQIKAIEHRRCLAFRSDSGCFRISNPLSHTHSDSLLNNDEMLQYLRHRPAIEAGLLVAQL